MLQPIEQVELRQIVARVDFQWCGIDRRGQRGSPLLDQRGNLAIDLGQIEAAAKSQGDRYPDRGPPPSDAPKESVHFAGGESYRRPPTDLVSLLYDLALPRLSHRTPTVLSHPTRAISLRRFALPSICGRAAN